MRYQILGPLDAFTDGAPVSLGGPKQRLVLAVLLIEADRVVSDDRLVDELWTDEPPDGARHAIQTYVSELRRVLTDEIVREGRGYRIVLDRELVDAHRFETLVAAARQRTTDAPASAATILREALSLWHGEPYGGVAESPLLRSEIQRLSELRLDAVEDRLAAELEAGRHAEVVPELGALSREHPYRERLHALHMLALYRSDRQADALRAYHRARRWLAEEMGIDPSPGLQALERQILTQNPALAPPVPAQVLEPHAEGSPHSVRGFELRDKIDERPPRTTYRAYQASVGREVSLTMLRGSFVQRPEFMTAFDLRARRVSELDHPNLVPLLDWWRDPDGAFVITPWIRGGSVRDAAQRAPWSVGQVLRLVEQVGGALQSAHRQGLVHGALDASCVLLDTERNALLGGFPFDPDPTVRDGPPEGRRGESATERSDIWGLGGIAVEALAGAIPNHEAPAMTLGKRRTDLDPDLVAVLAQATSPMPADRQERVADLVRDLRRAAGADVVAMSDADFRADRIRNPYKGLHAFSEADASDFFGRSALIDRLMQAVLERRLVVLAGPSGSGKSSVIRAGLLPALRAGHLADARSWVLSDMFPGAYPFEELAAALLRVGIEDPRGAGGDPGDGPSWLATRLNRVLPKDSELLLFVDQFEELWSVTEDDATRRQFIASLVEASHDAGSRLRVVAAMRADFLDRALESPALGEVMRDGLVLVTPPTADELAQAIARPSRTVGLEFESGLVDTITRDVLDQPGALPLLQHALTELFARRDGRRLTAARYRDSGGVAGALGQRAEEVYRNLPPGAQGTARQVFLRLVTVDEEHDDTRRRILRSELGSLSADRRAVDEVLRQFGAHRLLSFDRDPVTRGPTVEVAHEALFREWPTLRTWIETRREDLIRHRRMRAEVTEWEASGRSTDYLFSGARLEEAEQWQAGTDLGLSAQEQELLAESRKHQDLVTTAQRRRRRSVLIGTSAAAAVALGLALLAFLQLGRAESGEREALARALAADSRAQQDIDQDLALLLAMQAVDVSGDGNGEPVPEAVAALRSALIAHRTLASADAGGFFIGFATDDAVMSAGRPRTQPVLWNAQTGETLGQLEAQGEEPIGSAVSADGRYAVETYRDAPAVVWELPTGRVVARAGDEDHFLVDPALSADGSLLAVGSVDREGDRLEELQLYHAPSGRLIRSFEMSGYGSLAFGPGGALAVADEAPGQVLLHDTETWEVIARFGEPREGEPPWIQSVAFSADFERLAIYAYEPSRIEVYDVGSEDLLRTINVGAQPNLACFANDGAWIVAAAADELVRVWDVASGEPVITLPGSDHLGGLACAPDGRRIAVSGPGGYGRIFDLGVDAGRGVSTFATDPPGDGQWLPDGSLLVAHDGGIVRRYTLDGTVLAERDGLAIG
ncbi:MAG: BTAD domain-containing putative transcriptional regulator, partial [Candidatus Limnocylindria bacterium]